MNKLLLAAAIGAAIWWYETQYQSSEDPQSEDLIDSMNTTLDQAMSSAGPVDGMSTSYTGLLMLKNREDCKLTPYQLGDGGWTVGWGHYSKTKPAPMTQDQADAQFAQDVVDRGEKWVKLYVTVELTQYEFDALVSIAYNMSPQSFKKFAAQVNAGNGIDQMAADSVSWVSADLQNGIRNRRATETNLFDNGVYAV